MDFSAKAIADSISPDGIRLTTLEVTFWRAILAEFNTHRVLTRNSSSSRAIPSAKIIERILKHPYTPIYWGMNQPGMVASKELPADLVPEAERIWLEARDDAVRHATALMEMGIHKQTANRLLEHFMWHTVLVTSTEWSNFFALRAHKDAQPEIQKAAVLMREAMASSTPRALGKDQWHLPLTPDLTDLMLTYPMETIKKISAGRCARVSYLTHDGVRDPQKDIELCERLVASGHMCYDRNTEVLTNNGWMYWQDLTGNEELFAVDPATSNGSFEKPQALHVFTVDEELYHISGQQIDLLVTKNHNMVVSARKHDGTWSNFTTEQAENIIGKPRRYLKSALYAGQASSTDSLYSSTEFMRLIGFFIGDGYANTGDQIRFHLKKQRKIEYLNSIDVPVKETSPGRFAVELPGIGNYFRDNFYNKNGEKVLPSWVLHISDEQVEALLDGLRNSDGSKKRHTWIYCTTSGQVADTLQALLHTRNQVGSISVTPLKTGKTYYKINISDRITPRVEPNQEGRSRTYTEALVQYKGKVYCATVSTGALMVRRNGKVVVSGNSPLEHVATPEGTDFIGNFRGWRQFRKQIPHEDDFGAIAT